MPFRLMAGASKIPKAVVFVTKSEDRRNCVDQDAFKKGYALRSRRMSIMSSNFQQGSHFWHLGLLSLFVLGNLIERPF